MENPCQEKISYYNLQFKKYFIEKIEKNLCIYAIKRQIMIEEGREVFRISLSNQDILSGGQQREAEWVESGICIVNWIP